MLNVLDTDYQREYSESYTGTVGWETAIEGYQLSVLYLVANSLWITIISKLHKFYVNCRMYWCFELL